MANSQGNPVVILGSLNDTELKNTIDQLVKHVDTATQHMTKSFDATVEGMKKKLQELGSQKVDFSGSTSTGNSTSGSSRRKKELKEEKDAVQEVTLSYDQMQAAMQRRMERRYGVDEVQQLRMQQHALEALIKVAERRNPTILAFIKQEADELTASLQRLSEKRQKLASVPNMTQSEANNLKYLDQELERLRQRYSQVSEEFRKADTLPALRQQYEAVRQKLREIGQAMIQAEQQSASTTQQGATRIDELKARLETLKQALKDAVKAQSDAGWDRFGAKVQSGAYPNDTNIQEKLAQANEAYAAAQKRVRDIKSEIAAIEKEILATQQQGTNAGVHGATERLHAEAKITDEIKKQAQAIRENKDFQEKGQVLFYPKSNGFSPTDNNEDAIVITAQSRLTIEEQIANYMQRQSELAAQRAREEEREAAAEQQEAQAANERLNTEQRITGEKQKQTETNKPKTFADLGAEGVYSYQQLAAAMAKVLQLDQSRIVLANEETDSIKRLNTSLRQMKETYNSLGANSRNSDAGKTLLGRIQDLEREINKLRSQASRPVDIQNVLGFKPQTLEDIAYKIRQLQSYKQGINITTPQGVQEIKNLNTEIDRLVKKQRELMGTNQSLLGSNNALSRSWNYMKNRLAFYMTMGATTQFVKNLIDIRGQYELNERALGILINSAERGTEIFNELSRMALVSPYTLIELSSAAKQLTAYDVAAKDVVDTTRRLADMASAVGVPIDRLTYALGQIKAYSYLNARDARMFANAGIPLVKELADHYTELEGRLVSTADVYDRIKKKAVDYNTVMSVVNEMTDENGKFFNFQAKMADTLKVRIANLNLAWNNMLNDIGKEQQGVLTWGIKTLEKVFLHWKDINTVMNRAIITLGIVKAGQLLWLLAIRRTNKEVAVLNTVFGTKLATAIRTVGAAMKAAFTSPLTWIGLLVMAVGSLVLSIIEGNKATKEFNQSLREGAKSTYDDIVKFLEQYQSIRAQLGGEETRKGTGKDTTVTVAPKNDMDTTEATKAWEAIRNQIELSSQASDTFIGKLLNIKDVNERVREGFDYLESLAEVEAALKDVDDDTIKITKDWSEWWNLWQAPDGLVTNVKEFTESYKELQETIANSQKVNNGGDDQSYIQTTIQAFEAETRYNDAVANSASHTQKEIDELKKSMDDLKDKAYDLQISGHISEEARDAVAAIHSTYAEANTDLQRFQNDLKTTTDSINNFIKNKGWQGDPEKVGQAYDQIVQKQINEWQLTPDQAYQYQLQVENARSQAVKEATQKRVDDDKAALKIATDNHDAAAAEQLQKSIDSYQEQLNNWQMYNGRGRVIWNDYTKWLKEQHISELKEAYRTMTKNGTQAIDYSSTEWQNFVMKEAQQYAKEHKMSYDEAFKYLYSWVKDANKWSIFIPLTISTEEQQKSEADTLSDWDKKANDAYKKIQRLQRRIKELNNGKAEAYTGELAKANQELTQAQNDLAEAERNGGHSSKEDTANKKANAKATRDAAKAQREAESELQKALGQELQLIDKVRQSYKTLTDAGMSRVYAVEAATQGYSRSLKEINRVFNKYGMANLDLTRFVGTDNPRSLVNILEDQLKKLKGTGKAKPGEIQQLEVKIRELKIDAQKYDYTKLEEGLNNELSRLSDEYELAVQLDADPEIGNVFANMMGIDINSLPRTVKEYAAEYTKLLNKYLSDIGAGQNIPDLLSVKDSDIDDWKEMLDLGSLSQKAFDAIVKGVKDVRDKWKKNVQDVSRSWDSLLDKFSDLQGKLMKISKDTVQQQLTLVRKFGNDQEVRDALNLADKINISQDPNEVAELQQELATLLTKVVKGKPLAIKLSTAITNEQGQKNSKAQWDAFKESDLYTMTFEDMSRNSTMAIQLIMDKLDELKDKVKDDPASMKALMSAYEQARNELETRDPFQGMVDSVKELVNNIKLARQANRELKEAQDELTEAQNNEARAQSAYDDTEDAPAEARIEAEKELKKAKEATANATNKVNEKEQKAAKANNQVTNSEKKLNNVLNASATALNNVSSLLDQFTQLLGITEDSEAGQVIAGLSQGFQTMATVLTLVAAAAAIAEMSLGWVAVVAAALSVVVGMVSFLSNRKNNKINKQVEQSEIRVTRLQNALKDLENTADNAYGAMTSGATAATRANKELQLAELQRQLQLEKSRSKKKRDESKIADLEGQIIDMKNEINNTTKDVINDLLGISSAGDGVEGLVSAMIDAFRNGEDAMEAFGDKWDEMIDNMILKLIVSTYMQKAWDNLMDKLEQRESDFLDKPSEAVSNAQSNLEKVNAMSDDEIRKAIAQQRYGGQWFWKQYMVTQADIDAYRKAAQNALTSATDQLDQASLNYTKWTLDYMNGEGRDYMTQYAEMLKNSLSQWYTFGEDSSDSDLSALQQGIQSITEDTAGALEGYMNGVSQQVYAQTDILVSIRDAVLAISGDATLGVQAQILLQLQSSYQVQMTIQQILDGVLNPSGRAFQVEMIPT